MFRQTATLTFKSLTGVKRNALTMMMMVMMTTITDMVTTMRTSDRSDSAADDYLLNHDCQLFAAPRFPAALYPVLRPQDFSRFQFLKLP